MRSSGSGSYFDPWVIEDFLIEGNDTLGWGINVTNTTDYVVFRNGYINETGTGGYDLGIFLAYCSHITLQNVTVENCGNGGLGLVNATHLIIDSCNINYNPSNVYIEGVYDVRFMDTNIIPINANTTSILVGVLLTGNYSRHVVFENCSLNSGGKSIVFGVTDIVFNQTIIGDLNLAQADDAVLQDCYIDDKLRFINTNSLVVNGCVFNSTLGSAYNIICSGFLNASNVLINNCSFVSNNTLAINMSPDVKMDNLNVTNCFFTDSSDIFFANNLVSNVNFINNTIGAFVEFRYTINVTLQGNVFSSTSYGGLRLYAVTNSLILNNTFITATTSITLEGCAYYRIINNTFYTSGATYGIYGISFTVSNVGLISGNHFMMQLMTAGIMFGFAYTNTNILINGNTFDGVSAKNSGVGIDTSSYNSNFSVIGNWFIDVKYPFEIGLISSVTNISGNYFDSVTSILKPGGLLPSSMERNYYRDYFSKFPQAITNNAPATGEVLQYQYTIQGAFNDTEPLYYEPWYVRNQMTFLQFDSIVNGQEIPLGYLRVYIDDVLITTITPIIDHVLFTVKVFDLKGRLYYNATRNLNQTGIYLQIYLDVAVQVFFDFYSTIDFFGFEFTLVKLFVNGMRVTTDEPFMLPEVSNITVRDFANSVLFNHAFNFSQNTAAYNYNQTGIYVDIGLPIMWLTITNNEKSEVIIYLTKNSVTSTIFVSAGFEVQIRLSTGSYHYIATYGTERRLRMKILTLELEKRIPQA